MWAVDRARPQVTSSACVDSLPLTFSPLDVSTSDAPILASLPGLAAAQPNQGQTIRVAGALSGRSCRKERLLPQNAL
jgi:hypothetical protein